MDYTGNSRPITERDFAEAADIIHVPVPTIKGVTRVEAAGKGFDSKGRIKMLFEPHIFYRELGPGPDRDRAVELGIAYRSWGQRPYPSADVTWERFFAAAQINETAAINATSWGLFQVMGFNSADAGYHSPQAMVDDYVTNGEQAQLDSFVRLVDAWDLEDELARRDARGFASKYNGSGYERNGYHTKLDAAWEFYDEEAGDADAIPRSTRAVGAPSFEEVRSLQQRLIALGYHEVGLVDGDFGTRTRSAMNAFRADRGLPLISEFILTEQDLIELQEVEDEGWKRRVDPARANTTPAEAAASGSDTVKSGQVLRRGGIIGGIIAGIGAANDLGVSQAIDTATGIGESVGRFLGPVQTVFTFLSEHWWVPVLLIGAGVAYYAHRVIWNKVRDIRSGKANR